MIFARPAHLLNRLFPKGNPRDRWPAWTDAPIDLGPAAGPVAPAEVLRLPDAVPLWRSFVVTSRDEEVGRLDGYGDWLLGELIRVELREHRAAPASWGRRVDRVIWSADRVVALLRPLPDGTLQVVRLPGSGPIPVVDADAEGGDR